MPDDIAKRYGITKRDIFEAKGCEYCRNTGYAGRIAIHELLLINQDLRQLIADRADIGKMREAAKNTGMKTLVEDGLAKVAEGITSIEEVMSSVFE